MSRTQRESPQGGEGIELSIVMPCLDEAETLGTCISKAYRFLELNGVEGEVVVGDNGSTDGSQEIARRLGATVVDVPIRGYGAALFYATQRARGRYIIMGDSDDSYDFLNLMPFLTKLRDGYDLVMGNRFLGGIKPGAMPWKNRYIGNPILSAIGRLLFRCPVGDFHCGIRGFSAAAFERLALSTTGMEYASEMVIKATLGGLRIAEVPTTLSPDGRSRPPHLRPWRDGWRHLRFMLLFSPRWLLFYPGLALVAVGLISALFILPGVVTIANVSFDIHSLAYSAALILIGFQAISFAVFSRYFAMQQGLLPEQPAIRRLIERFVLEAGLLVGAALIFLGLAASVAAVVLWSREAFGALDPRVVMRLVIPASLLMALGFQIVIVSLVVGTIKLSLRREAPRPTVS